MKNLTYELSPNSLSLMKKCERCFWLTQHKVWKRPEGIFPSLPRGIDDILKRYFDKFRKLGKLPPELSRDKECFDLKLFDNIKLLYMWRNNKFGVSYKDERGNKLLGAIDDLLVKDNKLIVLDYKTRGFALKENTANYYQDQLDIYNFLFRKNKYETEDFAFLLFYYPKEVLENGSFIFNTQLVKRQINVENAENIWKDALDLLSKERPEKKCEWCIKVA